MDSRKRRAAHGVRLLRAGFLAMGLAAAMPLLRGQEPQFVVETPQAPTGPPVTVRGLVLNATTGEPLPRALVRVSSNEALGALTDGEGRFEIGGVPSGVQAFDVVKPGFEEASASVGEHSFPLHSVRVAKGMPDLSFSLVPRNAIVGHLTLSTGASAVGIGLTLFRQTVVDGRTGWEQLWQHQTTPDGGFRFAGLRDGTYVLETQPEFDNEDAAEPSCNANAPVQVRGYAAGFYGGGQEQAGAARIALAGGRTEEVNLALTATEFHLAEVAMTRAPSGEKWQWVHSLLDRNGQEVEYPVHEEKDHSLCVYLPDGSYTWMVQASTDEGGRLLAGPSASRPPASQQLAGLLDFSMEGQPARNLRLSLAPGVSTPVHLRYEPGPPAPVKVQQEGREEEDLSSGAEPLELYATPTHAAPHASGQTAATQTGERAYEFEAFPPGSYWIHGAASRTGVCLGAVTSGGQNLARTPWIVGRSGAGTPIDVVLRTDCAKLTVQMPSGLPEASAGEGATVYIYAVPEFDSAEGVSETQMEQFGERTATIEDLTPGRYRVFDFRVPQLVEYRDPAVLDRLGLGKELMLEPGGSGTLVLEGDAR